MTRMLAKEIKLKGFDNLGRFPSTRYFTNIRLIDQETGASTTINTFGPSLLDLLFPGEDGVKNVLLGYPSIDGYISGGSFQGRIAIGRVANRIADAQYIISDRLTATLSANDGPNCLHGGKEGWSSQIWKVDSYRSDDHIAQVRYSLLSKDGDQGFRGTVRATVTVTLSAKGYLTFDYMVKSKDDIPSPANNVFHGYINLDGVVDGKPTTTVHDHVLHTNANRWQRTEAGLLVPTHEIASVEESRYDFRQPARIGNRFGETGYDNSLVFPKATEVGWVTLTSPNSGRSLTMRTDQEAFQLYTGFFLTSTIFRQYGALCLEAQRLVNLVNMPEHWQENGGEFRTPMVTKGNHYHHRTMFVFNQMKR